MLSHSHNARVGALIRRRCGANLHGPTGIDRPTAHRLTRSVVAVDGFTGERRFIENRPVRSDHRIDRKDLAGAHHEHIVDGDLVDGLTVRRPPAVRRRAMRGARSSSDRRSLAARRSAAPSSACPVASITPINAPAKYS